MNIVGIVAALAVVWAAVTGTVTLLNLLLGAAVAALGLLLLRDRFRFPMLGKLRRIAALALLFVYELFASAVRVAVLVLSPNLKASLAPAIVGLPLRLTTDFEITLLANLITLTPGTLTVDVSEDRKILYIHAVDCRDREALIRGVAEGFEQKIIEAFR